MADEGYARLAPLCKCGKPRKLFKTSQRYGVSCGAYCEKAPQKPRQYPKKTYAPKECQCCKKLFTPKMDRSRFCSAECYKAVNPPKNNYVKKAYNPKPCQHCKISFTPKQERSKFCSIKCVNAAKHAEKYIPRVYEPRNCQCCGATFKPTKVDKIYCGKTCKSNAWAISKGYKPSFEDQKKMADMRKRRAKERADQREIQRARKQAVRRLLKALQQVELNKIRQAKSCGRCSGPLVFGLAGKIGRCHNEECIKDRAKERKRADKAARRASEKLAVVELFDPIEILERDGWRCQICGKSTPKKLRGTYRHNAPELDHIVALANGGKHSRANTQCACRACNGAKGAGPARGQISLFSGIPTPTVGAGYHVLNNKTS
jgi:hypothetical protein